MGKFLSHITCIITIFAGVLCSCSGDGCIDNQSSIPLAGFYSTETLEPIAYNSIEIYGVGAANNSSLTSLGENTQQVYLPFRSTSNSTAFCFHYTDFGATTVYNDTIWFDYESSPYFASEECGAMYRYKITSTRHTSIFIDSVAVTDPDITNIDVERIKIFFKTN